MQQPLAYANQCVAQQRSLIYQCYQAFIHKLPNRYKLLDKLKRHGVVEENQPTEKTIYLSEKAKKLLRVILKMIFRGGKAVVKQKYLYSITKCCAKQNRRLINELLDFIQFTKIPVWEGRKKISYYSITLSTSLQEEIKAVEFENENKNGTKMSTPIYNRNFNKLKFRSRKSKFLANSDSSHSTEQVATVEANNATIEPVETKAIAGSKGNVAKFKQYEKPKSIADHYPLSEEDCYELQKRSGTKYNLQAMNEILLDMSRKPELQDNSFESKARFMSYMTKAFANEGRDVNKTNLLGFKIMKRRPKAEVVEITTLATRQNYLKQEEDGGIFNRSDYKQYRARIAGGFPINLGYDLLTNIIAVKKEEEILKISMHKLVPITEHFKQHLLDLAKGIGEYMGVVKLEIVLR